MGEKCVSERAHLYEFGEHAQGGTEGALSLVPSRGKILGEEM